jgi:hypothetical protein
MGWRVPHIADQRSAGGFGPADPGRGGQQDSGRGLDFRLPFIGMKLRLGEGDNRWLLSAGTIDLSFAITQTGAISLGADGELANELSNTCASPKHQPT